MYCMNCGVRLGPGEQRCPLCGLRAVHPDLPPQQGEPLYPPQWSAQQPERSGLRFLLTALCLVGIAVCLPVDLNLTGRVTWSGFALTAMGASYAIFVLPLWFSRPNPVWMIPADFLAVGLMLLYINCKTGGGWFLSFAFPVTGLYGLLTTGVPALVRYVRRGYFLIFGGACIVYGCSAMLLELFQSITFGSPMFRWSLYPVAVLSAFGLFWVLAGLIPRLGDALRKRIFI